MKSDEIALLLYAIISLALIIIFIIASALDFFNKKGSLPPNAQFSLKDLYSLPGQIGRAKYLFYGILLFLVKHNLDRLVSILISDRQWTIFDYLKPSNITGFEQLDPSELRLFIVLSVIAIPFVWSGVILTYKRLKSLNATPWLITLFFIPLINLVFFTILCLVPSKENVKETSIELSWFAKLIPTSSVGSAILACLLTAAIGTILIAFSVQSLGSYGWGIFMGAPFMLGFFAVVIFSYHRRQTYRSCMAVVSMAVLLVGFFLILFLIEGVICIIMSAAIVWPMALLGGSVGYLIVESYNKTANLVKTMPACSLLIFGIILHDHYILPEAKTIPVTTSININANADTVWKYVIEFGELDPPSDWVLKTGIAYPLKAKISGQGVGAIRECIFTTGAFIEPITHWEPPVRLDFSVAAQPPAMEEWNPLTDIFPAHLNDYLISKKGQFLLTQQDGQTRIDATTWYSHNIWPQSYWRIWSDFILHRIHGRVLRHIKKLAEKHEEAGGAT